MTLVQSDKKNAKTIGNAVIAGAGPAGLTAAYEFLQQTDIHPVVFESTSAIGGISQTVQYKGNRMDIGGHRFFSKSKTIMEWWNRLMPLQSKPAIDDILLNKQGKPFATEGPDPETDDRVMLVRHRVSRIFFLRSFFDYPISLKLGTFTNMGLWRTFCSGMDYFSAQIHKRPETSLENFYINRFGKTLYKLFFEDYTEKVWGKHPRELGADWGSQRVKGVSVLAVLKDMFAKKIGYNHTTETSLIEQFIYPKYGPGQLWETVANEIRQTGGELHTQSEIKKIHVNANRVTSVDVEKEGETINIVCDYFLSSMPIKDLVAAIDGIDIPADVQRIAGNLPYRDFITVGLLVKKMKISNCTKIKTYQNRPPDTWIYIQERDVRIGRLQIFNNWSPYLVKDYEHTMWIGLEYFCTEGDDLWQMSEDEFITMATNELARIDIIDKNDVLDAVQVKIKKAYPSYFGTYYELDKVRLFLDGIENLFCLGRNGQHRYNNMDHSMLTAIETVRNIKENRKDKSNIWNINTEEEYHETTNK
ncbi:MAG: NAD(P)/FAD-dependent oxidoreductase [Bacteroidales bacterium]|jgi:protoporphyrinogen oxidase|nr:NAD(P)/FAD-dependent oxidoreductase [Bacteroidales bacterium]